MYELIYDAFECGYLLEKEQMLLLGWCEKEEMTVCTTKMFCE